MIWSELTSRKIEYTAAEGKLTAIFSRLRNKEPLVSRQSLNASFIDLSPANSLVKLPKFDGEIKSFTEWRSLFEVMIHLNDNLKPVQKLYFLKQAMIGDVRSLLRDFRLEEDMYDPAWIFINNRFYNKRAIIATHFRVHLLKLPLIMTDAIIRGLTVCGLDTDKMSPLIAYIVVTKLPEKLHIAGKRII